MAERTPGCEEYLTSLDPLHHKSTYNATWPARPWGTEGPELLRADRGSQLRLYYDCTLQPVPPGHSYPLYGLSLAPYPAGLQNGTGGSRAGSNDASSAWATVPGSCTGSSAELVFPEGATHGSFLCVSDTQALALVAKWTMQ